MNFKKLYYMIMWHLMELNDLFNPNSHLRQTLNKIALSDLDCLPRKIKGDKDD